MSKIACVVLAPNLHILPYHTFLIATSKSVCPRTHYVPFHRMLFVFLCSVFVQFRLIIVICSPENSNNDNNKTAYRKLKRSKYFGRLTKHMKQRTAMPYRQERKKKRTHTQHATKAGRKFSMYALINVNPAYALCRFVHFLFYPRSGMVPLLYPHIHSTTSETWTNTHIFCFFNMLFPLLYGVSFVFLLAISDKNL